MACRIVAFGIFLLVWAVGASPSYAIAYQEVEVRPVEEAPAEVAVAPKSEKAKPLVSKKWFKKIQKIGADYERGETSAQTDLARSQLIESITKSLDGSAIKIRTKVREVRWSKGFAKILTEREDGPKVSKKTPLRIVQSLPIELKMTQAEAVAIVPGQRFEFRGQLKFNPRKWGAVGPSTNSQQMYDLRHEYLAGGFLGTFTSTNFECFINGKKVESRWAVVPDKDGLEK